MEHFRLHSYSVESLSQAQPTERCTELETNIDEAWLPTFSFLDSAENSHRWHVLPRQAVNIIFPSLGGATGKNLIRVLGNISNQYSQKLLNKEDVDYCASILEEELPNVPKAAIQAHATALVEEMKSRVQVLEKQLVRICQGHFASSLTGTGRL